MRSRVLEALTTLPNARGWWTTLLVTLLFTACALPLGLATGLLQAERARTPALPLLLRVLIFPGLAEAEELIFRVLPPPRWAGPALVACVLAHPLNAWLFFWAARDVFYKPTFLLLAALLGRCCTMLYCRTRSLWSPVVLCYTV